VLSPADPPRRRRRLAIAPILATLVVAAMLIAAPSASATVWTVTTTADTPINNADCLPASCSLRQAITASSGGDTISLPASATPYTVSNGQLDVSQGITITGAGAASSVIEATAGNDNRVMRVFGNATPVTLQNLTITGGDTATTGGSGGGIAAGGPGPLVLDGVDVVGNTADTAIASDFNQGGGGIFSLVSVTLNGSTVSDNTATVTQSTGDSGGGGILIAQTSDNSDNLTVQDSTIADNIATVTPVASEVVDCNGGGGIYQDGGNLTIVDSTITDNTAAVSTATTLPGDPTPTDGGGGIFEFGNEFLLQDSTVAGNVAHGPGIDRSGGGGILDSGNESRYLDSTITANSTDQAAASDSSDGGGGILLNNVKAGVTMAGMTINANSASQATGGGVVNNLDTAVEVTDSILAGNTASDSGDNCDGPMQSLGYNLTDDPAADNTCSLTATGDVVGAHPGLGTLAANGGPTPTEALLAGSPAIGAGNPAGCTDLLGDPLVTDQRGVARPQPGGGRCDIGAYEVALPVVTTGDATVFGSAVVLAATAGEPDPRPGTLDFQYGTTTAYGSTTAAQTLTGSSSAQAITSSLSGLAPGTYHFRAVAVGPDGTTDGADGVFTIPAPAQPAAPAVTAGPATAVGPYSATLTGVVNPQGLATTAQFAYGTSTGPSLSTGAQNLAAVTASVTVTAQLAGLRPDRTYHYALIAGSSAGQTTGGSGVVHTAARPRPRALSARATPRADGMAPYTYAVAGRLRLPSGLTAANGCRGTVRVRAIAGHAIVGRAHATVTRGCTYRAALTLTGPGLAARGRARLYVAFGGNAWLAGRSTTTVPRAVGFGG
jgi:CSLREA domain-containing protein